MALALSAVVPAAHAGVNARPAHAGRPSVVARSAGAPIRPVLPARRPALPRSGAVRPVASLRGEPEQRSSLADTVLAPAEDSSPAPWWQALARGVARLAALSVVGLAVLAASPFSAEAARQKGSSGGRVGGSNFGTSRTATTRAAPATAPAAASSTTSTTNNHHHHTTVVHSTPSVGMGGVVAGAVVGSAIASTMAPPVVVASPMGYGYGAPAVAAAPVYGYSSSYFMYKAVFGGILAILLLVVLFNMVRS